MGVTLAGGSPGLFVCRIGPDITLRILEERHAEALFRLTEENREHLREWLPWVDSNPSVEQTRGFIRQGLQQFAAGNGFHAGIWYKGRLAGVVGFHPIDWLNRKAELGYWLGAAFQGRGIMTRAVEAMLKYSFETLKLHRVEIRCAAENRRSRAVPERLGFTQEGVLRGAERLHEGFVDHVVYGLLEEEWRARRARPDAS